MKTKSKKSFPIFFAFLFLTLIANVTFAAETFSSELIVSPSSIEAGKSDVSIYLLGLNTQLFSHSSKKEPTIEADEGVTIKDFRILSPKRAQLTIDTAASTIGAIKHSLKFYDPAGEVVVKTCVFYVNVLGPKTANEISVRLYSIPEITLGKETIQEVGSFEIEGNISGKMTLTPPSNVKFMIDYPPRITSLSVDASVYNIEVDASGDDIEFVVENPQEETIRLFFTDLFVETSSASGISGDLVFSLHSNAFESALEVPAGHTPGYTIAQDDETSDDETESNNGSSSGSSYSSSTSGKSSYSGTSSNSTNSTNRNAADGTTRTYSETTYYGGGYYPPKSVSRYSSSYYGGGYNNYGGNVNHNIQPNGNYVSRNARGSKVPAKPQGDIKGKDKTNVEELADNLKKDIKVSPGKGGSFKIMQIAFCNEGFDKKSAIPLIATNKGFEADMNLELTIESKHTLPDIIDVVISVGEKYNRNIQLKKYKDGVFRSIDIQKFSIAYNELEEN